MDQAELSFNFPPQGDVRISPTRLGPAHSPRGAGTELRDSSRNGAMPSAVPALASSAASLLPGAVTSTAGGEPSRAAVLSGLRASIARVERPRLAPPLDTGEESARPCPAVASLRAAWTLGDPDIDALLGPAGLDPAGLHEIKPARPEAQEGGAAVAGRAGALAFALRLAARYQAAMATSAGEGRPASAAMAVLVCLPVRERLEIGRLHGPGLGALSLDMGHLLIAETARASETLWAMEEALRSGAVGLVVGCLDDLPLTPARRLALAAEQQAIPCLAVTAARGPAAGATVSRWRIAQAPTVPHPFDAYAPGASRIEARLERLRGAGGGTAGREALTSFVLEWCDEALRFRLAARLADRQALPP